MYLLVNSDTTVCCASDEPIEEKYIPNETILIEIKDKTLYEVVGNVQPHEAIWDFATQTVRTDPSILHTKQKSYTKKLEAKNKIKQFYPYWKQLNIMRKGTEEEQETMDNFIEACTQWSNVSSTTSEELEAILP